MPLDKQGKAILYKPWKNTTNSKKKYWVYVKADNKRGYKKIGFGHKDYGQFKDKLGGYKSLDHGDPKRKKAYYARHGKATSKDTAKYWSHKILW
jgi:hypothetical protein|tara:strand:- start:423 stop:704 length:282 start_codon:yes stop_codon:yes gene_type:complete